MPLDKTQDDEHGCPARDGDASDDTASSAHLAACATPGARMVAPSGGPAPERGGDGAPRQENGAHGCPGRDGDLSDDAGSGSHPRPARLRALGGSPRRAGPLRSAAVTVHLDRNENGADGCPARDGDASDDACSSFHPRPARLRALRLPRRLAGSGPGRGCAPTPVSGRFCRWRANPNSRCELSAPGARPAGRRRVLRCTSNNYDGACELTARNPWTRRSATSLGMRVVASTSEHRSRPVPGGRLRARTGAPGVAQAERTGLDLRSFPSAFSTGHGPDDPCSPR